MIKKYENQSRRIIMKLLNENFNDEVGYKSFIDELDSFDEFDLECISKDYDERLLNNGVTKDFDPIFESIS
jgi:hypothetical protein